jgi:hypothetical protein
MGGRAIYRSDIGDIVCAELGKGRSLRAICRDEGMPSFSAVIMWAKDNENFASQYARARAIQADVLAEEIVDIADEDPKLLFAEREDASIVTIDSAAVNHQRLRIDARKWFASKVAPKKYSDKLDVEHTGDISVNLVSYARANDSS